MYQRLQKVGVCMSYVSTINLVDSLGEDFDSVLKEWKKMSDVNTNEDFLQICFTGYILAAVMSALGMEDNYRWVTTGFYCLSRFMDGRRVCKTIRSDKNCLRNC